jgi:hypothetical protein
LLNSSTPTPLNRPSAFISVPDASSLLHHDYNVALRCVTFLIRLFQSSAICQPWSIFSPTRLPPAASFASLSFLHRVILFSPFSASLFLCVLGRLIVGISCAPLVGNKYFGIMTRNIRWRCSFSSLDGDAAFSALQHCLAASAQDRTIDGWILGITVLPASPPVRQ